MPAGNILKLLLTVCIAVVPSLAAHSEEKPVYDMIKMQQEIKADRKQFVAKNMQLTPTEAESFWPLYESYQNDFEKLNARSFRPVAGKKHPCLT